MTTATQREGLNLYKTLGRKAPFLATLALLASLDAQAIDTLYPASNQLAIDAISADGISYQNVLMTLNSVTVLGVDNGVPGSDTFNSSTRLLSLGSLLIQGSIYNNVRIPQRVKTASRP